MAVVVTLRGPKEVIDKIAELPEIAGIELDEPQSDQSLADAVDSPIGPQEIEQILQLITVAITTATAGVTLFEKIQTLLRGSEKPSKVAVVDPKNNKTLGDLAVDTDPKMLSRDLFP
ncbi:hypothetical protein XI06_07315 [Bradyrhizobium sp. CCBAU 11434]|uniref:hypothetical protein n=1 Tax=Bradyrhizobium sp. CCBAU 11434 TaxID=1630885 RepID=UPI002306BFC1|nr:hypothetical protein [Bradyrhizobium sp. CCBAU 11434]MDA9520164.1 hypothetical protein [Bradyrhizobium sp. CCBAU 11434]